MSGVHYVVEDADGSREVFQDLAEAEACYYDWLNATVSAGWKDRITLFEAKILKRIDTLNIKRAT